MTNTVIYTHTHSVTYVADNILKSLKDIILLSGLDPARLVGTWDSNMLALRTWLNSRHLKCVVLEIYNPKTSALIIKWEIAIVYGTPSTNDGFWTDTEQLKYHIQKAGLAPSEAAYGILMDNMPGRPDVPGWAPSAFRPTDGMLRQSLGSTIEHGGLGATAAYWRSV
jgi:hypothetical protein